MRWVFKTHSDQNKGSAKKLKLDDESYFSYVWVSNFEAEALSHFMNSSLRHDSLPENAPKLYSFISLIRSEQIFPHLQRSSLTHAPTSLHMLAGSIHAQKVNHS